MASSFPEQISTLLYVMLRLEPKSMLDIGKGFGKYGFLMHEYIGVPEDRLPDPTRTLKDQSTMKIDAVEIQPNYMWPHIEQIYNQVHMGDITEMYRDLTGYDLVLMADVIEHLDKPAALEVVKHFLADGSYVVISTPRWFFHQEVYDSEWETHRSFWSPDDFSFAPWLAWQVAAKGRIYVLGPHATDHPTLPGFGRAPVERARRFVRTVREQLQK